MPFDTSLDSYKRKTRLDRREYQDGYPLRESRALNSLQFKSECKQNNSFFYNVKNILRKNLLTIFQKT
jgi:hypothetical protein